MHVEGRAKTTLDGASQRNVGGTSYRSTRPDFSTIF